jgi:uncharacterized membrane protein HdeD (DUF308 family)
MRHGFNLIVISLILFAVFATLLGGWTILGAYSIYAPIVLLFLLGIWFIIRGIMRRK